MLPSIGVGVDHPYIWSFTAGHPDILVSMEASLPEIASMRAPTKDPDTIQFEMFFTADRP